VITAQQRRRRLAGAAVLAAGIVLGSAAAPAQATHRSPAVIVGHAAQLHPQGVAWDPTRNAFLVGSIRHGTVSVVDAGGTVRTLIEHPRMVSTTGVHVDRLRGRVLVGYADVGLGTRTSPETVGRLSGVGMLVVNTADGTLFRVSPRDPRRVDVVALDRPLVGGDGMALRRDGTLVVVANTLAGAGDNTVSVLRGTRGWSAARTTSRQPWPDQDPTTVAVTPAGSYVVTGHLRELATGHPLDTFILRRVRSGS
jgi:DNA-binding beta-propeller fold protein YncE